MAWSRGVFYPVFRPNAIACLTTLLSGVAPEDDIGFNWHVWELAVSGRLLLRAAMLRAVLTILTVRPSVRPSVTCWYCVSVRTNELRMMSSSLAGSSVYLVFGDISFIDIFARVIPSEGVT